MWLASFHWGGIGQETTFERLGAAVSNPCTPLGCNHANGIHSPQIPWTLTLTIALRRIH